MRVAGRKEVLWLFEVFVADVDKVERRVIAWPRKVGIVTRLLCNCEVSESIEWYPR